MAGKLPEFRLLGIVKAARVNEAVDEIRLPQRNETIPLRRAAASQETSLTNPSRALE